MALGCATIKMMDVTGVCGISIKGGDVQKVADSEVTMLIVAMLIEVKKRAPRVPGYFEQALALCTKQIIPDSRQWFITELEFIGSPEAQNLDPEINEWSDPLKMLILNAASIQVKPANDREVAAWRGIMKMPQFANMAIWMLTPEPRAQLELLQDWWDVKPHQAELNLQYLIRKALASPDVPSFLTRMKRLGAAWSIDLRMAVNATLQEAKQELVFPPLDHTA